MTYKENIGRLANDRGWTRSVLNVLGAKRSFLHLRRTSPQQTRTGMTSPRFVGSLAGASGRIGSQAVRQQSSRVQNPPSILSTVPDVQAYLKPTRAEHESIPPYPQPVTLAASIIEFRARSDTRRPHAAFLLLVAATHKWNVSLLDSANLDGFMPVSDGVVPWFCKSASHYSFLCDTDHIRLYRSDHSLMTNR
jgi:hypothetical protein